MPSTNERRSSAQTRERVLDATHELFYWHGIHATGVDAVASAAEVAPTTLYRIFGSKDGLVAAYVASIHTADQTRTIVEVSIAIVLGGIGTRLLFRTED